ncbi:MAG: tetratricopeptide repeat protein [Casimicrobiaceae bacterium]|nr:tetratricopeptide repeat protein [Casimicrobiaceae bacterium]
MYQGSLGSDGTTPVLDPKPRLGRRGVARLGLIGLVLVTAGCAAAPGDAQPRSLDEAARAASLWAARHHATQLYTAILAAEIALQQGDLATASAAYAELVRLSDDEAIAERAVELSMRSGDIARALRISQQWAQAHPHAKRPRLIQLTLALVFDDAAAARQAIDALIGLPRESIPGALLDAARILAQQRNRDRAVALAQRIVEAQPELPESHYLQALIVTGPRLEPSSAALSALDRALERRPHWPAAVLLKARLQLAGATPAERSVVRAQVLAELEAALGQHPDARELRELRARLLYEADRLAEARREFLALAEDNREDAEEHRLAAALAAFAARDWDTAERELLEAQRRGAAEASAIDYYLARIAEAQSRWAEAAERYARVERGERAFEALLRRAIALSKLKRVSEATALLHNATATSSEQQRALAQVEALVWREARQYRRALAVLEPLLHQTPDNTQLLYDTAILLEYLQEHAQAEQRLRRVIELEPDNAHALNALGYGLADRNERLAEARALIERAHRLAPGEASIIDSMGWIAFREGRLEEAERYLREAFALQADGEIAAHLGEVLWVQGRHDEARAIWRAQLAREPDHEVLRATIRRLLGSEP